MKSVQRVVSDGTLKIVDLSISYFDRSEIAVYINAKLYTDWRWASDVENRIIFNSPIPAGVEVLIKRTTDISKLRHYFSKGSAFTAEALDEDLQQVLHIAQEATEADLTGNFFTDIDMHGHRVKNIGQAVDDSDALTLRQYKQDAQGAWAARNQAEQFKNEAASYAGSAQTSANKAAASAQDSLAAASSAQTYATSAAASASAAAQSATNAAAVAASAAQSATNAAASFDAFDDRYLGSKASDPTTDNDGNALQVGALYWNTNANEMRVWNGSSWRTAAGSLVGNADTATRLQTARTITIGNTGKRFDGSADVSWSLAEIGGDASLTNYLPAGTGAVVRTVQDKMREVVSVKDFGAVCDGVADDTAAIQRCCTNGGVYYIPSNSVIRLTAPITISKPTSFVGDGCVAYTGLNETAANVRGPGAWFHLDHTGKGFVIDGTSGTSDSIAIIRFSGCGTFRNQPTPGAGSFTPTANDWDFDVADVEFEFDDFIALNPTKFFTASLTRGGRLRFSNVRGQPLQYGIYIDKAYDLCYMDVHFWPYWSLNTNVRAYTLANLYALVTGRVDGLLLHRFFTIFHYIGWNVIDSGSGTTNGAHCDWVYLDNGTRGLLISASGATINASEFTAYGRPNVTSYGMEVAGSNNQVTIGFGNFDTFHNQAIYLYGTGNRVQIATPKFTNYSYVGVGPGVVVGAGNSLVFNGPVKDTPLAGRFLLAGAGLFNTTDQWTTYTPAVTAGTGSITTLGAVSAKYRVHGDMVDVTFSIEIKTNGTGKDSLQFTLPFTPADFAFGAGRETTATGQMCIIQATPGSATAQIWTYANRYPGGDGHAISGSISYRKQ